MSVQITLLTQPSCALCDHAKEVLDRLTGEFDLTVRELAVATPEGQRLAVASGMAFPPALLVNGQPFAFGRLSERGLRRELIRRQRPAR